MTSFDGYFILKSKENQHFMVVQGSFGIIFFGISIFVFCKLNMK